MVVVANIALVLAAEAVASHSWLWYARCFGLAALIGFGLVVLTRDSEIAVMFVLAALLNLVVCVIMATCYVVTI